MVAQNGFGGRGHRNESVSVALHGDLARLDALLFLAHIRPDLIKFHVSHLNVDDQPPHECFALLAGNHEYLENRPVVNAGYALDGVDGTSFH